MEMKFVPLNAVHEKLGAKMVPFAGYNMPVRYSSDIEEHMTVRNGAGVFDVSHMGEFTIKGPHALDLIQRVTSNDASKLVDGQAQYSCLPNETGGIVDDLIVYKVKDNDYLLVVNASNIEKDWNWISKFNNKGAEMKNISDDICLFAVQGPKAVGVLQRLTSTDLSAIKYYHFAAGELAGIPNVILSNTGYTGAGGFEVYVNKTNAEKVWQAIFDAGKDEGIKPIGLGARDTLRLEMGFCLYGNDIDDTTSPLEGGLGWITKFTKVFTNSTNIQNQKETGVSRKLVGFKMIDKGIPRHDYPIKDSAGKVIGKVTSGTQSPMLGIGIGLGYVTTANSAVGTEIFIDIRNKALKAIVSKTPLIS
ncbi:MAG: glycine cleavage system aminomethyltransferase GcvT [Cytophagales bacterium]|nr:glycine cleavage system aminomethyltransferase GcvT [Cytophagales bacterium]MCA6367033.1 glycine cleavage system aminomethyltransferase GcvT [Cytophagales bacterium]MCA6374104.1 glycine cleavage system aminomethyltransferase GcvT [Cytophagales bacterium]MCA6375478.1 glycine cleavage system aminomethyltransferase GcvT [Cytophagales bacterium]MCA6382127.1 glycine cleavage system aminomethyltransferase GcvT [Cytophagales bacterium]